MTILDIILSVAGLALVLRLLWVKFKSHPSDKYHNDSWKNRKN
ncbi:hypothetical protein QLS91_16100 [Flavobacterium sp. LB2P84]|nr:hypothetical protein [Flavobacterium yafengii]MDI6034603.1 hypothetical protein [Flavobacterium yafengii]